ncbi:hypothetical protein ACFLT4_06160 [Chloroflexota bacterium]
MAKVTIEVYNPRAEVESVSQEFASPRLSNLAGKKIGVLNNIKSGGQMLLPYILEALKKRIPDIEFHEWVVPHPESQAVKEPILKEIVEYSDGVIALIGD